MNSPRAPISERRAQWFAQMLPESTPVLWCPLLTHYTPDGALDRSRITAHLQFISRWVKGILVPGSTGDGWELTAEETRQLLDLLLAEAPRSQVRLLIGALNPDLANSQKFIAAMVQRLQVRMPAADAGKCLAQNRVCGFTVCPPKGAALTQAEIEEALTRILDLNVPLALYQLPQVTQNEMSPELVETLARKYAHFMLFKDTSGKDRVANSGRDFEGVFMVRGMEGDYARWTKPGNGPYDGFLLSTANSFGRQLHEIGDNLRGGHIAAAIELAERLTALIQTMFQIVGQLTDGNAFANAGKAVDHFFAHGPKAVKVIPPRLHAGSNLPVDVIHAAGEVLATYRLMPARGYLE